MTEKRPAGPRFPTARGSGTLARRFARYWSPEGSAPKPGRRMTAPKGGARQEREALRGACGSCSIQIRRRPPLDQQVGSPARTARRQTHQSDIVIHASTLLRSGYIAQQERSRTKRPYEYGRGPGDAPGAVWLKDPCGPEIRRPNSEVRKKAETRNPKNS
jgi:hypothetical protein